MTVDIQYFGQRDGSTPYRNKTELSKCLSNASTTVRGMPSIPFPVKSPCRVPCNCHVQPGFAHPAPRPQSPPRSGCCSGRCSPVRTAHRRLCQLSPVGASRLSVCGGVGRATYTWMVRLRCISLLSDEDKGYGVNSACCASTCCTPASYVSPMLPVISPYFVLGLVCTGVAKHKLNRRTYKESRMTLFPTMIKTHTIMFWLYEVYEKIRSMI